MKKDSIYVYDLDDMAFSFSSFVVWYFRELFGFFLVLVSI